MSTTERALAAAEAALVAGERGAVVEQWSRLAGLLDLEARGAEGERAQAMVLRLQRWLDTH